MTTTNQNPVNCTDIFRVSCINFRVHCCITSCITPHAISKYTLHHVSKQKKKTEDHTIVLDRLILFLLEAVAT